MRNILLVIVALTRSARQTICRAIPIVALGNKAIAVPISDNNILWIVQDGLATIARHLKLLAQLHTDNLPALNPSKKIDSKKKKIVALHHRCATFLRLFSAAR
jgi:hypothetical protein